MALLGKGPLAGKPGVSDTGTTQGQSSGSGENSNPTDMGGVTTKQSPGDSNIETGNGVPDKSQNMSPPGTMPGMPTFMMPIVNMMSNLGSKIANLISPTAPTGGTTLPNGNVFVPGLSITGAATGGPGPGAYTPSITTVYGNTTYTNFNPVALVTMVMKMAGLSAPEMVKQPTPPMMMSIPSPIPVIQKMVAPVIPIIQKMVVPMMSSVITPMQNLVTIMTSIPAKSGPAIPEMVKQPTPPMMMVNNLAFENLNNPSYVKLLAAEMAAAVPTPPPKPPGSTMVTNPLVSMMPSLLSMLGIDLGNFGQSALNNLMSNAGGLQNLLSKPLGIAIPPIGAPSILPDITV